MKCGSLQSIPQHYPTQPPQMLRKHHMTAPRPTEQKEIYFFFRKGAYVWGKIFF